MNSGAFQSCFFFFSYILTFSLEKLGSSNYGKKSLQDREQIFPLSPEAARKAQNILHHKTNLTTLILTKICKTSRLQKLLLYPGGAVPHL